MVFALSIVQQERSPDDFRRYYLTSGITLWLIWNAVVPLGMIVGPIIPGFFAESIGVMNLLLITAALQLVPVALIPQLERLKVIALGNADREADLSEAKRLARNPFSGFVSFLRNPYLLAIGLFIVMYVTMSTFVYMELREFLAPFERAERTEINARIDLAVNTLAIATPISNPSNNPKAAKGIQRTAIATNGIATAATQPL